MNYSTCCLAQFGPTAYTQLMNIHELPCHRVSALCRTFQIPCWGRGVLPSLKMSTNAITFAPTALSDTNTTRITLANPRLSRLSSPVIQGAILPQGAKAFEFLVPEGVPVTVSPRVGTIQLGEVRKKRGSLVRDYYTIPPSSLPPSFLSPPSPLSHPPSLPLSLLFLPPSLPLFLPPSLQSTSIELSFSPTLASSAVSKEALRLATEEAKTEGSY